MLILGRDGIMGARRAKTIEIYASTLEILMLNHQQIVAAAAVKAVIMWSI